MMPDPAQPLLVLDGVTAGYGDAVVLDRLSLTLAEGRSLALLGRNGTGKTTLVNTIIGVTRHMGGRIVFGGRDITQRRPEQRARAGIGWVPQERNIFKSLTVDENLTAVALPGPWTPDRVYALFPRLAERRRNLGNQLSGGEQQMLAIARALVLNPRLLLLDEPTEGLAPIIVEELMATLTRIVRDEKLSTVIVEQHAQKILGLTDAAVVLERGRIAWEGVSRDLLADAAVLESHLGVARKPSRRSS
jgi:branched-chain amino acid transport system ATP-binding protein